MCDLKTKQSKAKTELIDRENRLAVARGGAWGWWRNGRKWSKSTNLGCKKNKFRAYNV